MLYQILALGLLGLFYGCYFIKMLLQRKKGIKTDQIGKGKSGFVKYIEIALKLITYITPAAEVISILLGISRLPDFLRIIGLCIGTAGVMVFIVSVRTMQDNWRAGVSQTDQTELVTQGIYRHSRNPAFLGFDLVYLGILLMFFNYILLGISAAAVLMLHLQIVHVEETFLMAAFGDAYGEYKKQVCRYIGRKRLSPRQREK